MALKTADIRDIVAAGKPGKYFDDGGLMLLVTPAGSAVWKLKYRAGGVEKKATFGPFPAVSLAEARNRRDDFKTALRDGRDPMAEKKSAQLAAVNARRATFGAFAAEVLEVKLAVLREGTQDKWKIHLGYATRRFGARAIDTIRPREVLDFLKEFEACGKVDTAHSIKRKMGSVFRHAMILEACASDPTAALVRTLRPVRHKHFAAITQPAPFGELLRACWAYTGDPSTRGALRLIAYTFQRPHMVRQMRWRDIDWEAARWDIPQDRMKGEEASVRDHSVPLSRQVIALLRSLQPLSGDGELVFPARGYRGRPISENTMRQALIRLGYDNETHVPHGFRSSANTMIKEQLGRELTAAWGIGRDRELQKVIDLQLAHVEENSTRRAYDRVKWWDERITMMQMWADWCDARREGGKVIALTPSSPKRA